MSVLDRSELEQSHLSDLHAIASELGIEGYRRLGRDQLIDSILAGGGGGSASDSDSDDSGADEQPAAPAESGATRRRGRRLRLRRGRDEDDAESSPAAAASEPEASAEKDAPPLAESNGDDGAEVVLPEGADEESAAPPRGEARRPRPRGGRGRPREDRGGRPREDRGGRPGDDRGGRSRPRDDDDGGGGRGRGQGRGRSRPDDDVDDEPRPEDELREGVLDVLPGGSGFMRADAFVHARDDVYVSPAQIRRCELRAGDRISGPVRPPRRSERYPSLVRVSEVNGQPAEPPAERPSFDDLTPTFPTEPLETVHGLPFGKGSRVAIGGPPGAGATRLLREVRAALEGDLDVLVVLAGVRPEEVTEWKRSPGIAVAGGAFDRGADELAQVADMAVERGKRIAEAGGHAVLVIDGLDTLSPAAARRVFGSARNTEEAGSLTIVAATGTAEELQRLASTRVALTPEGALDPAGSGTLRADLLGGGGA
jgi:transcription termination factor Rho